jgi:hypothetical protein
MNSASQGALVHYDVHYEVRCRTLVEENKKLIFGSKHLIFLMFVIEIKHFIHGNYWGKDS